jgi:hypothetical protein
MSREQPQYENMQPTALEIGGGDDMPRTSQELDTDDVNEVVFDTRTGVADRREQLTGLLAGTRTRRASDDKGDIPQILGHLEDGIVDLSSPQKSQTVLGSNGMNANSRGDADGRARLQDLSAVRSDF